MNWSLAIDSPAERERIRGDIARLRPWYHSFTLADWLVIEGNQDSSFVLERLDHFGFPADFTGKRVLDVGCNAGHFSFVAKRRGAREVVGVELDPQRIRQARYLANLLGLDVKFVHQDVHDLDARLGTFDAVICTGLLYHIPDPTNALARIAAVCSGSLYIECEFLIEPELTSMARFIEGDYKGDRTNWWIIGPECMAGMVRAAGFRTAEFKGFFYEPEGGLSVEGIPLGARGFLIGEK